IELRTLVCRVACHEFFQTVFLLGHFAVSPRVVREDKESLTFRNFVSEFHRPLLMVEELLGRRRIVGEGQFGGCEGRIERDRLVKVLERFLPEKSFGSVSTQQKFISRLV